MKQQKKDLQLLGTKLTETYMILVILKNIVVFIWREKHKPIKNNYSATKSYRKTKHC